MLSVHNLTKIYQSKKANDKVVALNNVSIDFPETGLVFLLGKSGSGKSTLLNTIGGLDSFDSGEIIIKGKSSKNFSQSDFDSYRNTFIGFIFQEYNILEEFTVAKNLELAIELQGKKPTKELVNSLLEQVELTSYAKRKPNQLSGGQKQRVAIARALIKNPEIIMADEPTGALDSNTGKQVMETLKKLSENKLVIIVSHDRDFAETYGDRIVELKDGNIISDTTKKEIEANKFDNDVSVIDGNVIHIKKGHKLTKDDLLLIEKSIILNAEKSDTIISMNEKSNVEIKKVERITDDGNKESFVETKPEDIRTKQYNPNELKLIRSKLKFKDSFKMGASALKNKVAKLVFTILLSFFAFTVFGIVDTLSCWNRAESVYQGMVYTNQKNFIAQKEHKESDSSYMDKVSVKQSDIDKLNEEFPDYVVKGVLPVDGSYYSYGTSFSIVDYTGKINDRDIKNPVYELKANAFVSVSKEDLDKFGFTLEGRLPEAENEICISKLMMENITRATNEEGGGITSFVGLKISFNSYDSSDSKTFTVVGIVDDKTDLSKYTNLSDQEVINKKSDIENALRNIFSRLCYVSGPYFQKLSETGAKESYYCCYDNSYISYTETNGLKTFEMLYSKYLENVDSNSDYGEIYVNSAENRFYTPQELRDMYVKKQESPFNSENLYDLIEKYKSPYVDLKLFMEAQKDQLVCFKGSVDELINADGSINLNDNEIILPDQVVKDKIANYETMIQSGQEIWIDFKENGDEDGAPIFRFKLVGVIQGMNYSDVIISKNTYNTQFKPLMQGYEYIISALNGSSTDKEFVTALETLDKNNMKFTIQNDATRMLDFLGDALQVTAKIFMYIAIAFAVFAALLLMNFISTSISYKKREIGVLRALGARGADIFGIFFNESTIIAFINFILATIATIVGSKLINATIISELGYAIPLLNVGIRQILLILAISWGSAFVASFLPIFKISRKKPIDAINNR